jgi:hypothetical protein
VVGQVIPGDTPDDDIQRFRARFNRGEEPGVRPRSGLSYFSDTLDMFEKAPVVLETTSPGHNTGDLDAMQFSTGKGEKVFCL